MPISLTVRSAHYRARVVDLRGCGMIFVELVEPMDGCIFGGNLVSGNYRQIPMRRIWRPLVLVGSLVVVVAACTSQSSDSAVESTTTASPTTLVSPTTLPVVDSNDGWQSTSVGLGVEGFPVGVWATDTGFVLASVSEEAGQRHLLVWRSSDGIDWIADGSFGPVVGDRIVMDVASEGVVAVVEDDGGWDLLLVSRDGIDWQAIQPDVDWIPDGWRQLDGFQYVQAGFRIGDVEVGPQGVAAVLTPEAFVDFETAVRYEMPDATDC